ncbi:peptide-methionine (S)-S-oxide reductase [Aquimarina sp. 2201CG14-23]|uniref:peptide-methionine (S)-S-oxide reductase n=1 Tax=Aquimarina mycalae TaxID=3040073 RepID=UPI002478258E|nr:peptide-methionine (S)-S-oxide reductase [Aquimarina sp. 2201CG14-23]MDH7444623.1 peptide-methionine (S)-S-oxide reductase [Aquimarina sp. 2201CG14-23]
MMNGLQIGLGGGCHWCTEAVFQSLKGVNQVEQGYISSVGKNSAFSEAVLVSYNPQIITLKDLIEIHLHTHKSTSDHSFREKYRSAVYYLDEKEKLTIETFLNVLNKNFGNQLITQVLAFKEFKSSRSSLINYYRKNPEKPFCQRFINPKLDLLRKKYADKTNF